MGSRLRAPAVPLIVLALSAWQAAAAAGPAVAQPSISKPAPPASERRAADLFARGIEHFEARDFEQAIAAFEQAYRLHPRSEILFALAQAERQSGDCLTAVSLYRRFLEGRPAQKHAEVARQALERCEAALASKPLDTAAATAASQEPQAEAAPPIRPNPIATVRREPQAARSAMRDPLGLILLAGGVLGVGAGGVSFAISRREALSAESADTYEAYVAQMDRAEQRRTLSWIGMGAGVALLGVGSFVYFGGAEAGSSEQASVALAPRLGADSVALVAAGHF